MMITRIYTDIKTTTRIGNYTAEEAPTKPVISIETIENNGATVLILNFRSRAALRDLIINLCEVAAEVDPKLAKALKDNGGKA